MVWLRIVHAGIVGANRCSARLIGTYRPHLLDRLAPFAAHNEASISMVGMERRGEGLHRIGGLAHECNEEV